MLFFNHNLRIEFTLMTFFCYWSSFSPIQN